MFTSMPMDILYTLSQNNSDDKSSQALDSLQALEDGRILFFPEGGFPIESIEKAQLTETILDGRHKNISYQPSTKKLGGLNQALQGSAQEEMIQSFMHRYYQFTNDLINAHLPYYKEALIPGRTSYRPAQISGRKSSKRKDDRRIHIDAFPATPVHGNRILRVFTNINWSNDARVWQVGENLESVINQFYPTIPTYRLYLAKCMKLLKATKSLRSRYDHCMMHIHDNMKLNDDYQSKLDKTTIEFPAQSSWVVFTDQVSHAALSGKQLLEQTFYLPIDAMANPSKAPLSLLTKHWQAA